MPSRGDVERLLRERARRLGDEPALDPAAVAEVDRAVAARASVELAADERRATTARRVRLGVAAVVVAAGFVLFLGPGRDGGATSSASFGVVEAQVALLDGDGGSLEGGVTLRGDDTRSGDAPVILDRTVSELFLDVFPTAAASVTWLGYDERGVRIEAGSPASVPAGGAMIGPIVAPSRFACLVVLSTERPVEEGDLDGLIPRRLSDGDVATSLGRHGERLEREARASVRVFRLTAD